MKERKEKLLGKRSSDLDVFLERCKYVPTPEPYNSFFKRDKKNVWRTLKKMEIDGLIKNKNRKWYITPRGAKQLRKQQKKDWIPIWQ